MTGADAKDGLGWIALILAIGVAVLPYVAANVKRHTQQIISFCGLAAGGMILLYLLIQGMRYVSIGLIVVIGGYILEFIGIETDRRGQAPTG